MATMNAQVTPLPICKAILLCDAVAEKENGTLRLDGVFSNFFVNSSLTSPAAEAFCQITDANGRYSLVAEIHDLTAGEIIGRSSPTEIEVSDPLLNLSVIISIPPLKFQTIGLHDLVILANGEEIDRKRFGVTQELRELQEHGHES